MFAYHRMLLAIQTVMGITKRRPNLSIRCFHDSAKTTCGFSPKESRYKNCLVPTYAHHFLISLQDYAKAVLARYESSSTRSLCKTSCSRPPCDWHDVSVHVSETFGDFNHPHVLGCLVVFIFGLFFSWGEEVGFLNQPKANFDQRVVHLRKLRV